MHGIKRELKRIGILTMTTIKWENMDGQCKVTITGVQENCNKANAHIKEVVVSVQYIFHTIKCTCTVHVYNNLVSISVLVLLLNFS